MKFKKSDVIFAIICIVVVGGLIVLWLTGKPVPPVYLSVPQHEGSSKNTTRIKCLECHEPEKGINDPTKRIKATHPYKWRDEKFPCIGCHEIKDAPPVKK